MSKQYDASLVNYSKDLIADLDFLPIVKLHPLRIAAGYCRGHNRRWRIYRMIRTLTDSIRAEVAQ